MNDIAFIELTNGGWSVVDADLFPVLNKDRWSGGEGGRAYRNTNCYVKGPGNKRLCMLLHRVVNRTPEGEHTDHINGFPWDNRRCNLRTVNNAQNHWNMRKKSGNYTSKYKGVHYVKRPGRRPKWSAQTGSLVINRKRHIGYFESEEDAAMAYDAVAREHFGEFAQTNFPT